MNKYPNYIINEPKPLVFFTGYIETEPDIHERFIREMQITMKDFIEMKDLPSIIFRSVPIENALLPKKSSTSSNDLNFKMDGILKYNWTSKHFDLIPSVLIFTIAFNIDWSISEWARKEALIQGQFTKLKANSTARDLKILLIIIKTGINVNTDKDVLEERLSSLRKHLQLDTKYINILTINEIISSNSSIKKLCKTIRDYSTMYYSNKVKYYKNIEKSVIDKSKGSSNNIVITTDIDENILLVRCYYKIAFFYEFHGQSLQALRYYRQCYTTLLSIINMKNANDSIYEQVKIISETINFKICKILLLSNSFGEVFQQFKIHISRFKKIRGDFLFKHYSWISDQYLVLVHLLEYFNTSETFADADRSFYYQNAAKYSLKRYQSFMKYKSKNNSDTNELNFIISNNHKTKRNIISPSTFELLNITNLTSNSFNFIIPGNLEFQGMLVIPPKYIGSHLLFEVLDNSLLITYGYDISQQEEIYKSYLIHEESKIDHYTIIMNLLNFALEKENINNIRKRGLIFSQMAEQLYSESYYVEAMDCYKNTLSTLLSEGWILPAISILNMLISCAIKLGKPIDILYHSLLLYANAANIITRHELEVLHLNIFTLFEATLSNDQIDCSHTPMIPEDSFAFTKIPIRNKALFITTSYKSLISRSEYGEAITLLSNPESNSMKPMGSLLEYCLPNHFSIDMSLKMNMFDVKVSFNKNYIELGQSILVTISMTSKFIDTLEFNEMKIYFTEDVVIKQIKNNSRDILHSDQQNRNILNDIFNDSNMILDNKDILYTSLIFPSKQKVEFSFYIHISEPSFTKFLALDMILCLERIELLLVSANTTNYNNEDVLDNNKNRDIIFNVNAFPAPIIQALKNSNLSNNNSTSTTSTTTKAYTLKDIVGYCAVEGFNGVLVKKPAALIQMLEPLQNVNMLHSILQRLNIYLRIDQHDLLDGYIYLASDYLPQSVEDSLFWYPNTTDIESIIDIENMSDELLDKVRFHPMLWNSSLQPIEPLYIPAYLTDNSITNSTSAAIICIPLFLKHNSPSTINITMKVEFNPKGILKSSITKEFNISTCFLSPFHMEYTTNKDGSSYDSLPYTIQPSMINMLSSCLICLNSLQHAIVIDEMCLHLNTNGTTNSNINIDNNDIIEILNLKSNDNYTYPLQINQTSLDDNNNNSNIITLKSKERIIKNIIYQYKKNTITSFSSSNSSSMITYSSSDIYLNKILLQNQLFQKQSYNIFSDDDINNKETIKSIGNIKINWHLLQTHLLRYNKLVAMKPFILQVTNENDSSITKTQSQLTMSNITLQEDIDIINDINILTSSLEESHLLDNITKKEMKGSFFHWLLSIGRTNNNSITVGLEDNMKYLDINTSVTATSVMEFPIPDIKIKSPPFKISMISPSHGIYQEPFELKIKIQSFQRTLERIRCNAISNDNYLLTGTTLFVLEIDAGSTLEINFIILPLKCGIVSLPMITLYWDRGINNTINLLEIGNPNINNTNINNDIHQEYIFIQPNQS